MSGKTIVRAWGIVLLATIAFVAIIAFCLSPSSRGSAATDTTTVLGVAAASTPPPE